MALFFAPVLATVLLWVEGNPQPLPPGISCVATTREYAPVWRPLAPCVEEWDPAKVQKLPSPMVRYRYNVASASSAPWLDSNGWRYMRAAGPMAQAPLLVKSAKGKGALAASEALTYRAKVAIQAEPAEWAAIAAIAQWGEANLAKEAKPSANFTFVDDGSAMAGENLNLLQRRNLQFQVAAKAPAGGMVVLPKEGDPAEYAYNVRQKVGDEKRLLRIYGSEVVLGRMYHLPNGGAELHLLNYSERTIEGVRFRAIGKFKSISVLYPQSAKAVDQLADGTAAEATIEKMPTYVVLRLNP